MADKPDQGGGQIQVDGTAIADSVLAGLYHGWSRLRRDHGFPHPDDLDEAELGTAQPYVLRVKVLAEDNFLYETAGARVHADSDPSGLTLEEALPPGPYRDHMQTQYRMALRGAEGVYTLIDYFSIDGALLRSMHRLFLPLSQDGHVISHMLVGQRSVQGGPWTQPLWQCELGPIRIRETIPLY